MHYLRYPNLADKSNLFRRNYPNLPDLQTAIQSIFEQVQQQGDQALLSLTSKYDGVELPEAQAMLTSKQELENAASQVPEDLKNAIKTAYQNIYQFHQAQKQPDLHLQTAQGIELSRKEVPIERVGLYVPGGTAPLFSTVLMLAVPAQIAQSKQVVLCTPPQKDGSIHPAILFAAQLCEVSTVVKVGGAQAIAAMSLGTETVPSVHKLFGPGNAYVTAAKQYAQNYGLAIDMPAGPSELLVIADDTATPAFVAADFLSQIEHGGDSQSVLICTSEELAKECEREIVRQAGDLPRKEHIHKAMENSYMVLVKNLEEALLLSNEYAPEHLILNCAYETIVDRVEHAGSVFLGNYTPESLGDYASGTNHTLPTNAYARAYSGLSLNSYMKTITFQKADKQSFAKIADAVASMAEHELLEAHKRAVTVRKQSL